MDGKTLTRKYKYYQKRIEKLWTGRQRIEALLYMSLLVEFLVKDAILNFEKIIEGSALYFHVGFNPRNLYSKSDLENQPLGYLIRILNTYTKDKGLIGDLKKFAKMRNECIHKLFEQEIKDVNKKLKNFDKFYFELLIKLMELNVAQMNLAHAHFNHICDDCFKKILPKEAKL